MKYFEALSESMRWLGEKNDTIFIGQAVNYPGTALFNTLKEVPEEKRIELPVFEETQLGISSGLCLTNFRPISIFPRWNFLLCATNQLVNHLDKYPIMSENTFCPNPIIRTAVGSEKPLFPGYQHIGNMSEGFKKILTNIEIIELKETDDIIPAYKYAYEYPKKKAFLIVEFADFYNEK
ncbi:MULTISPECIES: hypothetical protein [Prochlorococcus]|uniref:Transketolase-like pyrimidine-binding domain-containing protein n=1 Tax=Prochlorococcus marinus str. MIT 9116 TaxID=167544 RepID=A0A0A1ZUM7_PROMR|nr:hypothetical protein [Prochlorococcus marinus]KGF91734.1 hypothetical protein EU92_0479 [Prochlorococcus marinus str. MIT 9107]KGF93080.1 hypothetical protein EU93_0255 [Prochlorococcus marinus str. MIT 9116]KGF93961.1 hypothetical protein EU94_0867 [Prochlorococcus marinus str. MIT 9123]